MIIEKTDETIISKGNQFLVNDDVFKIFKNKSSFYTPNMVYLIIESKKISFNNEITIKRKEANE